MQTHIESNFSKIAFAFFLKDKMLGFLFNKNIFEPNQPVPEPGTEEPAVVGKETNGLVESTTDQPENKGTVPYTTPGIGGHRATDNVVRIRILLRLLCSIGGIRIRIKIEPNIL